MIFNLRKHDRYGRFIAYVYLGEKFINRDLVGQGYLISYTSTQHMLCAYLFLKLEYQLVRGKSWTLEINRF
ncbi:MULTISPECIES: thermonuclease family protein [unclassified Sphingobacterium]|uniref:thermonuclease family protein n=1 Tax=unclassified Sphingobacterium TaxID=2609468 RepID=UPI0039181EC8